MPSSWERLQEQIDDVRRDWAAFRRGGDPGRRVRPPIGRSWWRCRQNLTVEPRPGGGLATTRSGLDAARAAHQDLLTTATSAIANLKAALCGSNQVLVLCDPLGRALLVEGDHEARRAAEAINLVPGSDWSEAASGTNAMGTALADIAHTTVFASEHYLEELHPWACVATPILHPVTGAVVGLLDLSGREMVVNQHTELAVLGAALAIQAQIAAREAALREVVLAALAERLALPRRGGLGAIDRHGRLLQSEGVALPPSQRWARSIARLLAEGEAFEEALPEMPSLRLVYHPVQFAGELVGALVDMDRSEPTRPAEPPAETPLPGLIGRDPRWLSLMDVAARSARTDSTILITGETGTGKDVVARAIHQASARSGGPFIAVNCGALPPSLAASHLFGYVGGAFTGANPRGHAGLFESAQQGTLFLDEVSELTPEGQVALLRVLQEREVTRVGSHQPIRLDVRVIAASNKELPDLVARGLFRQDLFYRLSVVPVHLPPLRERTQDILPLLTHGYRRLGQEPPPLPPASWQRLLQHPWPGNVRELLNLVEQAVALGEDPADLLPLPALPATYVAAGGESAEEEQIRRALDENHGNAAAAARALGMGRSTLYRKLELYGIRLKRQVE